MGASLCLAQKRRTNWGSVTRRRHDLQTRDARGREEGRAGSRRSISVRRSSSSVGDAGAARQEFISSSSLVSAPFFFVPDDIQENIVVPLKSSIHPGVVPIGLSSPPSSMLPDSEAADRHVRELAKKYGVTPGRIDFVNLGPVCGEPSRAVQVPPVPATCQADSIAGGRPARLRRRCWTPSTGTTSRRSP